MHSMCPTGYSQLDLLLDPLTEAAETRLCCQTMVDIDSNVMVDVVGGQLSYEYLLALDVRIRRTRHQHA